MPGTKVKRPTGTKRGPKGPMTAQHKEALAVGRVEGRAVREYLEALRVNKPRRGRRRTPDSIRARLKAIDTEVQTADALTELKLRQEKRDLEKELTQRSAGVDRAALEKAFISVAKSYGERQGISYASWRDVGVEASVLKKAGIRRGSPSGQP